MNVVVENFIFFLKVSGIRYQVLRRCDLGWIEFVVLVDDIAVCAV